MGNIRLSLAATAALSLATALAPMAASAQTWNFTVLHTFTGGSDGGSPVDGISLDKSGNLFGTAAGGGNGNGTAFELKHTAKGFQYEVLYSFNGGSDGSSPGARLIPGPGGHLFGTTAGGGGGGGTVFELTGTEKGGAKLEKDLYSFLNGNNGYEPSDGDLVFDAKGNVYGTTSAGGAYGYGSVYKLTKAKGGTYSESVLYSFGGKTGDGQVPVGGLVFDGSGNLYGTTSQGGSASLGTVYQLVPSRSGWSENILWNFQGTTDGETPYSGLTFDQYGNLYGGATDGGVNSGGTIYELSPANGSWSFATLYSTPGYGVSGPFRTPYVDASGNVYGTTHCDGEYGSGSVYELTNSGGTWTYNSVHEFTGGTDGGYIFANPVFDAAGNISGTSQVGGSGYGVVWEASPQ